MLLHSILRLLWSYPRFPEAELLPGPYDVSSLVRYRLNGVCATIQYPAVQGGSNKHTSSYWSADAVSGMADYTKKPRVLLTPLEAARHPSPEALDPVSPPYGKWPVVLFSHGLAGCADMYTSLCRSLASLGYVVVALEHEDGSGVHARTHDGKLVRYKWPDDSPYSREKVTKFREPFLQQRVDELNRVLIGLSAFNATTESANANDDKQLRKLESVLKLIDVGNTVVVGHSFGAATAVLAAQQLPSMSGTCSSGGNLIHRRSSALRMVVICDPWAFSLPDETLKQATRAAPSVEPHESSGSSTPALCLMSGEWTRNKERFAVDALLRAADEHGALLGAYEMPGTLHQSISDTPLWFPKFVTKRLRMRGPDEVPPRTHQVAAEAIHEHIRSVLASPMQESSSDNVASVLARYPTELREYADWVATEIRQ